MADLENESQNFVRLAGKVSSAGKLRYAPSGIAVLDFTVSVEQSFLGVKSRGRYDILAVGDLAASFEHRLRIGVVVQIEGELWLREFKNRKGVLVKEVKIVAGSLKCA